VEGCDHGPNYDNIPAIYQEGLRNATIDLSELSMSARDLNRTPTEYMSEALPLEPVQSVTLGLA
jgi:hypothetical protein